VTAYHNDATYVKLETFRSRIESLYSRTLIYEPSQFQADLIKLRKDMFHDRASFSPLSFNDSISYDPSIFITCMGPYMAMYMAVSFELEQYLKDKDPSAGAIQTTNEERKKFLEEIKAAANTIMIWALDKRENEIKAYETRFVIDQMTGLVQREPYFSAWVRGNKWRRIVLGTYAILVHKVRDEAKNVIQKNIFDPLNMFLTNSTLPVLDYFVDKKVNFPLTIYGDICYTQCEEHASKKYWWCGFYGSPDKWAYCSPPKVTYNNKKCTSDCKQEGKSYYWCKTADNSWDYCSPEQKLNELALKWKSPSYTRTVERGICKTPCQKYKNEYWWCDTVRGGWDYCSPFDKDYELTYKGEICIGRCVFYKDYHYYHCETQSSWDYCSDTYSDEIPLRSTPQNYCFTDCTQDPNGKFYCHRNWYYQLPGNWHSCLNPSGAKETFRKTKCPDSCSVSTTDQEMKCYGERGNLVTFDEDYLAFYKKNRI
jgi:hypothetical protein